MFNRLFQVIKYVLNDKMTGSAKRFHLFSMKSLRNAWRF